MAVESPTLTGPVTDESRNVRGFRFSRLVRASGYVAVFLALASAAASFLILIGLTPIAPTPDVVFKAMLVNGVLVAFLVLVIAWVVGSLVVARSRGQAGAALHIRIVALFSLVAVLPAALLAVTASITLDRGLDNWFSTRTRSIVDNSLSLAQAFAEQQAVLLRADILAAKLELERAASLHKDDPARFAVFLNSISTDHNLPGALPCRQQRNASRAGARLPPRAVSGAGCAGHPAGEEQSRSGGDRRPRADQHHRRDHRPAGLRQYVPLRRTAARPQGHALSGDDQRQRRRIPDAGSDPLRHADRLRHSLPRRHGGGAPVGDLARHRLCQPAGGADPAADRRRQGGIARQSPAFRSIRAIRTATSARSAPPSTP